jgi:hypothetical protein
MKYDKQIELIRSGSMSREAMVNMRGNAERLQREGDQDAQAVLDELDRGQPSDEKFVVMGFCPGASFDNRLDTEWKDKEICTFTFTESEHQLERFHDIFPGYLVILKKRQQFGKTMRLYGHGRAKSWALDKDNNRYLFMDWSDQDDVIEVPLMGCNSTIDVKSREVVEGEMPEEFYAWLEG